VYFGCDVFGRGTFGGGGYRANAALEASRAAGVSAALFAPGWTLECGEGRAGFEQRQEQWWSMVGVQAGGLQGRWGRRLQTLLLAAGVLPCDAVPPAAACCRGKLRVRRPSTRLSDCRRTHGQVEAAWGQVHPFACRLPLSTTFNCGFGRALYEKGARVSDRPWLQLCATTLLPSSGASVAAAAKEVRGGRAGCPGSRGERQRQ
jgi:hypothetical protein